MIECKDLYSLRISSIEESLVDDKFIYLLKTYQKIANHMHLSLQSGCDNTLRRMNRKYKTDAFLEKVNKIKEARPDMSITTDVIVGFPGETEEDFAQTVEFIKECGFSKIHVFPYSVRSGTVAAKMKDQIAPQVKKERVNTLLKLSEELENKYISKFVGQEIEFLIEQYDKKNQCYKGHSSNYLECNIKNVDLKVNEIVKYVVNFDSVKIS